MNRIISEKPLGKKRDARVLTPESCQKLLASDRAKRVSKRAPKKDKCLILISIERVKSKKLA